MLIDRDRLNSLRDAESEEDKKWFQKMIETLSNNMENRLMNVQKSIEESDYIQLQKELHQIKGMTLNFGIKEVSDRSIEAENLIKLNRIDDAKTIANTLRSLWDRSKKELFEIIQSG